MLGDMFIGKYWTKSTAFQLHIFGKLPFSDLPSLRVVLLSPHSWMTAGSADAAASSTPLPLSASPLSHSSYCCRLCCSCTEQQWCHSHQDVASCALVVAWQSTSYVSTESDLLFSLSVTSTCRCCVAPQRYGNMCAQSYSCKSASAWNAPPYVRHLQTLSLGSTSWRH